MKQSRELEILDSELEQKTIAVLRWVFLTGGLGTSLMAWFDSSSGLSTSWDAWGFPITSGLYALSGAWIWLQPSRYTAAVLLAFFPTAIYQQGVFFWGIQFPGMESYSSAASGGSFFPIVYIVLFITLPRHALRLSWLHCACFFLQALYHSVYFWNTPYQEGQEAGWHLLVAVLFAHPIYILALRYIVTLREQLHLSQQASFQSKADFLGMLSHEIKNLLQGMITAIGLLELRAKTPAEKKPLSRLNALTEQFLTYLGDVTELTKLENPSLHIAVSTFPLGDFLHETHDSWQGRVHAKQLQLSLMIPYRMKSQIVRSDPKRLRQVIDNLLSNALKYTPHGEIRIDVLTDPDESSVVWIDIVDTGVGIDPADQTKIFEPYVRLKQAGLPASDGSGLGLTIVAKIMSTLGGSVKVISSLGHGATFRIVLPVS